MTSNTYGDGETAAEEAPWLLQGKIRCGSKRTR